MANIFQFDDQHQGRSPRCIACEEMLADALDQTLSPAGQASFDNHVTSCTECSDMFADAQRGAAWLELLKTPRPEPSATLMERILAQTSGIQQENLSPIIIGQPAILPDSTPSMPHGNVIAFRTRITRFANPSFGRWMHTYAQPRLAMTAAMAFFSIALTLNLTGVRLDQLKASNLNPANVRKTYYEASADAVRFCDNLRVVRVMESRVDTLRESTDDRRTEDQSPVPTPQPTPHRNPAPKPAHNDPHGPTSRVISPIARPHFMPTAGFPGARSQTAPSFEVGAGRPSQHTPSAEGHRSLRADSPAPLVAQLLFDPRNTAGLSLKNSTQEGGLA